MKGVLQHDPIRPARATHAGEQAFLEAWRATMAETWEEARGLCEDQPPPPIEVVLADLHGRVTQRRAAVLASIATWLGCNAGASILHQADREIARERWERRHAYLLAWALDNIRRRGVNSATRYIEHVLAREEDYGTDWLGSRSVLKVPPISLDDSETIEQFMLWLPSVRGQAFLRRAQADFDRRRDEERRSEQAQWRRVNGLPTP
jgi:hypothetical protein